MTDLERAVLALEVEWWNRPQHDGRKGNAIADLGMSPTRYHQVLARLARDPEAIASAPVVMRGVRERLRRGSAQRRRRMGRTIEDI